VLPTLPPVRCSTKNTVSEVHVTDIHIPEYEKEKKGFTKEPMRHKALFCEKVNGKMSQGTDVYFTMASTVANATMMIFIPMSQSQVDEWMP
jgi:hypothetical protein